MKKFICMMLAAIMMLCGAALADEAQEQTLPSPVVQALAELEGDTEAQIALLESMRAQIDALLAELGEAQYVPLERNAKGEAVDKLQARLVELGYLDKVNGKYDNDTVKAMKQFEKKNGLVNDGKASELDQSVLFSDSAINKAGEAVVSAQTPVVVPSDVNVVPGKSDPGATVVNGYDKLDYAAYAADTSAMEGAQVCFDGSVLQVISDGAALRVAVDGNAADVMYVTLGEGMELTAQVGDEVHIEAVLTGAYTFQSVLGGESSLPAAEAHTIG